MQPDAYYDKMTSFACREPGLCIPSKIKYTLTLRKPEKKDIPKVMVIQPTLLIAANVWCIISIARVYHK